MLHPTMKLTTLTLTLLLFFPILSQGKDITHSTKTILVFGDSLSAGYGLKGGDAWPSILQSTLHLKGYKHYSIQNLSVSGETTKGGARRFTNVLARTNPQIVILALGANDGLRGQSIKAMSDNLNTMISQAQSAGCQVILAGMKIPPNYGKRYTLAFEKAFSDVAHQTKSTFIPFLLEGVADKNHLFQKDRLHPTQEAQSIIANHIYQSLKPLLHSQD